MQPNKTKRDGTIAARQKQQREILLEKFRRMPILQIALDQTGIARTTYYRWLAENEEFKKAADAAIAEGETFITELSESKLISLINQEHFPAVQLWLKQHHPKYTTKLELSGRLAIENESLTPEQEMLIRQALERAGINDKNHEPEQSPAGDTV